MLGTNNPPKVYKRNKNTPFIGTVRVLSNSSVY
jgi:hypothetical protein